MADHEGPEPRDPQAPSAPSDLFRSTAGAPALDLAEALGGLDRATRNFARRLGESSPIEDVDAPAEPNVDVPAPALGPSTRPAEDLFEQRMREAEQEAREYLDHAKRRADSLVRSMVGAVEREASEMRRDAEAGIRSRWQQVEVDAERHLGEARRIADSMVAERQERIGVLSDGISVRAQALTAGMDDAERVREQFDSFVRALSRTADRIAGGPAETRAVQPVAGSRDDQDRPSAIAA